MPSQRILFVCVENSCRSQMAEGFARKAERPGVEVYSAGSRPSGQVNPRAVQFMAEVGVDLDVQRSKSLADVPTGEYAAVVTMGCGDACPSSIAALQRVDWDLPDPKHLDDDAFRRVRDEIGRRVDELLSGS